MTKDIERWAAKWLTEVITVSFLWAFQGREVHLELDNSMETVGGEDVSY